MIPINLYVSPCVYLIVFMWSIIWSLIYNGYKIVSMCFKFIDNSMIELGFGERLNDLIRSS